MVVAGERPLGPRTGPSAENLLGAPVEDLVRKFYHTKKVGTYMIGQKLGEGSFAKVREGLQMQTGEKVAVKVIDKKKAKKDSYVTKNFRREGKIQQMIRHPNITQLLDILETDNSYYLVMELCTGGNLMNQIYEKKRLDERVAQKYVRQLVMAVEHLQRAGVVHRDLKIENLLLDKQDNIKLIDFGLSNCNGILGYADPFSTQCGSPAYAAPELLSRKPYGPKVDVWSIGVIMYAMLTGTLPFTVEPFNLGVLHQKMVEKDMNPLPPNISSEATSLLKSLLEPDPEMRPNIHQVMSEPWLQLGNPHTLMPYLNRIHIEEINHDVLLHMTEQMDYKHSEVLSAVLTNRACLTLAVYYLLNNKMKRLTAEYQEKQDMEKKNEFYQTQWRKHIDKITIPPKQPPIYLAVTNGAMKEKKQKIDLLRALTGGLKDVYSGQRGCIASSSLEYLEIHPLFTHLTKQLDVQAPANEAPSKEKKPVTVPKRPPSALGAHSWNSGNTKEPEETPPSPWYKLTNGALSPPRHVSAFQPESSYLKKATIPTIPTLPTPAFAVPPHPKKSPTSTSNAAELGSSPPSGGDSSSSESPQQRGIKLPSMGIGQILKKRIAQIKLRAGPVVDTDPSRPHDIKTLLCETGALKTLC
ncbi:hormonally up-regulated neu tumor-associated kinase homolog [Denticeps clupeoides]|uniref:hormonally up-regulated neu tumor-associated kinase homolog n=1 Tax=Denticeps clupeoides TaxID=299321 RepID=UPI0010A53753|nr:hormonally up-regulated neu tumor-associated kinase [Denticeps clupeoides]